MEHTTKNLQNRIGKLFFEVFGTTPIRQRFYDISNQWLDLMRYRNQDDLEDELGDLMTSCFQLANELSLDVGSLIESTLDKVYKRRTQYERHNFVKKVAVIRDLFVDYLDIEEGVKLAELILNSSKDIDEVWLMPQYDPEADFAELLERLRVVELKIKDNPLIQPSSFEIKRELKKDLHQTAKLMFHRYVDVEFYFVDDIRNVGKISKDLRAYLRYIIYSYRRVEQHIGAWYNLQPHRYLLLERKDNEC